MSKIIHWIEDEMSTLRGLKHALIREHYQLHEIATASDALGQMQDIVNSDSHIILDLYLPTGDDSQALEFGEGPEVGLGLLQRLKEEGVDERRVIVLSGNIGIEVYKYLREEYALPDHAIIPKPVIEIKPLLDALNSVPP